MSKFFRFTALLIAMIVSQAAFSQSWLQIATIPAPLFDINSIAVVDANVIWVCGTTGNVRLSTNGGFNWVSASTGLPSGDLYGISAIDASNCWVGTATGSIYRTTNGGSSWTLQIAVAGSFINGIKMFSSTHGVYTGDPTGSGQPYQNRSTFNGGANWVLAPNSPLAGNEFGVINAWDWVDTTNFWIGSANLTPNATSTKIYKTTTGFNGTWSFANVSGTGGTAGLYYQAIAFANATSGMAASNGSNIVKTTDGGNTWTAVTNPAGTTTFAAINMNGLKDGSNTIRIILSETAATKCFRTTNYGSTWTQETLPPIANSNGVQHIQFVSASLGFGGGNGGVFYRYGPPVGIDPTNTNTPLEFTLEQNFPNPFNPSTTINYSVPKAGFVTVKIYNSIGVEVMTLVNGNHIAGNYTEVIDMSGFSSGIYFYTMTSGDFKETRKMMLVK